MWIDTGIKPDSIQLSLNNVPVMKYEFVPYWKRHFAAKVVEDINSETCKAIREHLFEKGYTDVLLLDDSFIREAIGKALKAKDSATDNNVGHTISVNDLYDEDGGDLNG